jgi:5-formyltetrahydrofolate cyclo-ligase
MTKSELRIEMRRRLKVLQSMPEQRREAALSLLRRVTESDLWKQAHNLLLFASLPDEIDTAPLLKAATTQGKQVWLPRVEGNDLVLCSYASEWVRPGAFHIMEPTAEAPLLTDYTLLDLALIPGIAFTPTNARLGRGRGYYDRLLPRLACPKIGLCYDFQVVDEIPTDPWDVCLDDVWMAE